MLFRRFCLAAIAATTLCAGIAPAAADTDSRAWLSSAFRDSNVSPSKRSTGKSSAATSSYSGYSSYSGAESGVASYYWQPQAVASGGRFNPDALTAAHKTLPFGTRVRVTNLNNGRTVDVVINDRGPYVQGRVIDLSRRAAQTIGMTGSGIARVNVQTL